ncbi:MAG: tetratricopeptide repeat protein, partial [Gammaproteobacteria bacterium]
ASEEQEDKRTVSPAIYERLTKAKTLMDEGRHGEAATLLKETLEEVKDDDYESALTQQSLAFAYLGQHRYADASRAMEAALAKQALPRDVAHALRYNLAQIYVQMEDYKKAHTALMRWLKEENNPSADAHFLAAIVHHHLKQGDLAITHVQKAISRIEKPPEDWYQFLLSLLFERKRYQEAVPILQRLVGKYPDKPSYWRYLTDVYLNLKREGEALGVLRCAYHEGAIEENDLIRMAQLYLRQGVPFSAARLLEKEVARGRVARSVKNLELLGNGWIMAREPKRAIAALRQAAGLSKSGHLDLVIAQMQVGLERWREAAASLDQALSKGGLKEPGEAQLLLGMSLYHGGEKARAITVFRQAAQNGRVHARAQRWLELIDRERNVAAVQR